MGSFIVFWGSIIATWYLAMIYESTEFMLLVYLEAALFVLSFFMVWYRKFTVSVKVVVPVDIAEPGKETLVKLCTKNKGFRAVARAKALLFVEDLCTGTRTKEWVRLSVMPKGETSFVRMVSFSGTGTYRLRIKKLRLYDGTGLFYGTVKGKSEAQIRVLPKLHDIPVRLSLPVRNFYGESDVYDEHIPGFDHSELFAVREYQKGDRLQNIHWKLTAKQDELMVKEHSLPKACPVVLFLAFTPKKRTKGQEKMVPYLEAAASLSFSLTDAGCPHYVAWYDEGEQDIVRMRVDDEESLFLFLGLLMDIRWKVPKEELLLRYKEKYRMEPFVWALSLDEKLVLKRNDEVLAELLPKDIAKSLEQIELVL